MEKDVVRTGIAVIGAGALGGAVARGLARAGCRVTASCPHPGRRPEVAQDGVRLISDNAEAARGAEVVMFALKPHLTLGAVRELRGALGGKLCVSLAAAVSLPMLEEAAPEARWARVMTNVCAAMNAAFSGVVVANGCAPEDGEWLRAAFSLLGDAEFTEEGKLDALTALIGSGPAFFLELLEGAALGGIQAGLPKALAYRGAAAAALGAARLVTNSGRAPSDLRDAVCTPGGMTIEGVVEIERRGVRGVMMDAVTSAARKGSVLTHAVAESLR